MCPPMALSAHLHRTFENSICVVHIETFLGVCTGINVVLYWYTLLWRV